MVSTYRTGTLIGAQVDTKIPKARQDSRGGKGRKLGGKSGREDTKGGGNRADLWCPDEERGKQEVVKGFRMGVGKGKVKVPKGGG